MTKPAKTDDEIADLVRNARTAAQYLHWALVPVARMEHPRARAVVLHVDLDRQSITEQAIGRGDPDGKLDAGRLRYAVEQAVATLTSRSALSDKTDVVKRLAQALRVYAGEPEPEKPLRKAKPKKTRKR